MGDLIRTYSELIQLSTFEDRLQYLQLHGSVGEDTFGFERYLNQVFYKTREWQQVRRQLIVRDLGKDLGIREIGPVERILVHHMNPLTPADLENKTDFLMNPEYLICTTLDTHNAIHYGTGKNFPPIALERTKGDTCPWLTR